MAEASIRTRPPLLSPERGGPLHHGTTALSFDMTTESMRAEPHHEHRKRS
jgi:hypothetical protein